jgi:hypothetical protein
MIERPDPDYEECPVSKHHHNRQAPNPESVQRSAEHAAQQRRQSTQPKESDAMNQAANNVKDTVNKAADKVEEVIDTVETKVAGGTPTYTAKPASVPFYKTDGFKSGLITIGLSAIGGAIGYGIGYGVMALIKRRG